MTSRSTSERYIEKLLEPFQDQRHRFTVESGPKHLKLRLDGRMVQVIPRSVREVGCHIQNARAALRRALSP